MNEEATNKIVDNDCPEANRDEVGILSETEINALLETVTGEENWAEVKAKKAYQQGGEHFQSHRYKEAKECFRQAVEIQRQSITDIYQEAQLRREAAQLRREFEDVAQKLSEWAKGEFDNEEVISYLLEQVEGQVESNPRVALQTLENLLAICPEELHALKVNAEELQQRILMKPIIKLAILHHQFAGKFTQCLSSRLEILTEVGVIAVDQMAYSDYLMSLSEPSCLCVLSVKPLPGNVVMEISPQLVFSIIDILHGGTGNPQMRNRRLTKFEKSGIEHNLIDGILETLQGTWEKVVGDIEIRLEQFEFEPRYVQVIPSTDTIMVVMLQVGFGQVSGLMSLCYPTAMVERALMHQDDTANEISSDRVSEDEPTEIRNAIVQMQTDIADIKSMLKSLSDKLEV